MRKKQGLEKNEVLQGQEVLGNTETSVLPFEIFLREQGIFLAKANEEEMAILKMTHQYTYRTYCEKNNFKPEKNFYSE